MRTFNQNLITETDARTSGNTAIILLELVFVDNTIQYYTNWKSNVVFGGNTYLPIPFEVTGINENKNLDIETVDLRISNVTRALVDYIKQNNAFIGQKVNIKLTFENLLSDSTAFIQDTYFIEKCTIRDNEILFSLSTKFNIFSLRIPQHRFSRLYCQWRYGKTGSTWPGCEWLTYSNQIDIVNYPQASTTSCDKTLNGPNGCSAHKNKARRRAFPGIPLTRIYL